MMGDIVSQRPATTTTGIRILAFNPLEPQCGSLRGFLDVHVPGFRLKLYGLTAHAQGDRRWIGLPGRPMLASDGNVLRDPETGRIRYQQIVAFDDDRVRFRFSDAAVSALDAYHPGWSEP